MNTADFINRVIERTGYKRESYQDKNLPTAVSNIVAIPWFGDMESTCLLSSLLLKPIKEMHHDKYVVLCSWPGYHDLFPYVDEYWSLNDESACKTLALNANNFYNDASLSTSLTRSLMENVDVIAGRDFLKYFESGFTSLFWEQLNPNKTVKRFLPSIPSESKLSPLFKSDLQKYDKRVLVYPTTKMRIWDRGRVIYWPVGKDFWDYLFDRLLGEGITPFVYQNWFTYDMSRDYGNRCCYVTPRTMNDTLAAIKGVGMTLDVHSGISRLSMLARTPFVAVDERSRYIHQKGYEIDDLCCQTDRQYIFSFPTLLMTGGREEWGDSIVSNIITRLKSFVPKKIETNSNESYEEVSYDAVRKYKANRVGAAFLRIER